MEKREPPNEISKVRFIYNDPEDYQRYFINGAVGGLTPRGELICNFFFEYKELPDSEEAVVEDGKLKILNEPISEPEIFREIKCSIILRPEEARSIAGWFAAKADEYDEHFKRDDNANLPAELRSR